MIDKLGRKTLLLIGGGGDSLVPFSESRGFFYTESHQSFAAVAAGGVHRVSLRFRRER